MHKSMVNRFSKIVPGHFVSPLSMESRKEIFLNCVEQVKIEIFSFCNRTCSFCPNSFVDRKSKNIFMSEALYKSIIDQLHEISYRNIIMYSVFNEPLADRIILDRIRYTRLMLPDSTIEIVTNGDYLNKSYFNDLMDSGLNNLRVSVYLPDNVNYTPDNVRLHINKIARKIDLPSDGWDERHSDFHSYYEKGKNSLSISSRDLKSDDVGFDRGGLIGGKQTKRNSPCIIPFMWVVINYDGKVMPCCNVRTDVPEHVDYILGDLNNETLLDVYFSKKTSLWRGGLTHFSENLSSPCATCREAIIPYTERSLNVIESVLKKSMNVNQRVVNIDQSNNRRTFRKIRKMIFSPVSFWRDYALKHR